jgi:hypothetical protein
MLANISTIDLYNLLRVKLGEAEAKALTDYVGAEVERKFEERKDILATRDDIHQLRLEMEKLRVEMKDQKSQLITWMCIFWIGQIAATLGIVFLFFKK